MSEALEILVVVAGCAVYAVMLIVPAVEYAAERRRLGVIRGGWLVSASGQQVVCRTKCHAPDMKIYRENWRQRRRGNGF